MLFDRPSPVDMLFSDAGLALQRGAYKQVEACLREVLLQQREAPEAWCNLGISLIYQGRVREAQGYLETALALKPDYRLARFNLSYVYLQQGAWQKGWAALECRESLLQLEKTFPWPVWSGGSLSGYRVLVMAEGGYGDMIQFLRYVPWLKQQGAAAVYVALPGALCRLFSTWATAHGVDGVFDFSSELPEDINAWLGVMSLPHRMALNPVLEPVQPYLCPPSDILGEWNAWFAQQTIAQSAKRLRVGLVWQGNPAFHNDAARSVPLEALAGLSQLDGVQFFALQPLTEGASDWADKFPGLILPPRLWRDFAETAAVIDQLDLVITVDTSVAHLAGALGKRCWVMLPDLLPDWRWGTCSEDTCWYPEMRLFRQQASDWSGVVDALRAALSSETSVSS